MVYRHNSLDVTPIFSPLRTNQITLISDKSDSIVRDYRLEDCTDKNSLNTRPSTNTVLVIENKLGILFI